MRHTAPSTPSRIVVMVFWKYFGAEVIPNGLSKGVINVVSNEEL